ncbi:MAG: DNA internalization-related competence protein ComEC/Rec2 [Halieaceae bacterium]|nr:DNA internalization-related competence protein ComEC/Rec2 [Halieaceae bacterium]MCP5146616.1 DNA internalization-related competence protein ComEC/Rec2 [Pseudomonadales bacterium]
MRSWMIGLLLGMAPVPLLAVLPPPGFAGGLALAGGIGLLGKSRFWRGCAGLALGAAIAIAHGHWLLQGRLEAACAGQPTALTGRVASLPRRSAMADGVTRQRFEFDVESLCPVPCAGPRRVLLSYYGEQQLQPGQWWQFTARLKKPWGLANPGSYNLQAWLAESGIDAVGSVLKNGASPLQRPTTVGDLANRLRHTISQRIAAQPLGSQATAVLAAITVADKSGIDASLWSLFQLYGINHLLVISGLHIGLVGGGGFLLGALLQRLLLSGGLSLSGLPALLALACASAYAALAGFSISTQRALCMLACFLLAGVLGRRSSAANSLLLAAATVLLVNPLALLGSGFWLSFAAVAALLWLGHWQRALPTWRRLLTTHAFMSLVMLPLGGWWFGGASLVAPLANLLMIPLVGMLVVPLALAAVAAMYLLPALEPTLWALAAWPLEQLLPPAQYLAVGEHRWLYRQLAPTLPAVLLGALGAALLVLPVALRVRALALLLMLPLLVPARWAGDTPQDLVRLTVLDVGQGTAVVLRSGRRVLVYDTGGGDPAGVNMAVSVLLPFLRHEGVSELDTFIVSHPDNDHSAGASTVLAAMPVRRIFSGGEMQLPGGRPCVAGQAWEWPGGVRFRFLSPALERHSGLASNDASCVLQIQTPDHRLLLPGDIEGTRERELVRYWGAALAGDWLLLPHHGSNTSSTYTLLKHVRPGIIANSSGYANRFGHPHRQVMERLGQSGAQFYDTASGGALQFELRPGAPVLVSRYRDSMRRFWM